MEQIKIMKMEPLELPSDIAWGVSAYHIALKDFIVYVDDKKNIMYVNPSVPEKDVNEFLECVKFTGLWFNDDERGKGDFLEYVYQTYGRAAYRALLDSNEYRMNEEKKRIAKESAETIMPLIENMLDDESSISYNEELIHEVYSRGCKSGWKTGGNIINMGDVYIFYLGYLMGTGAIDAKGGAAAV